jgi:hypothetical protein
MKAMPLLWRGLYRIAHIDMIFTVTSQATAYLIPDFSVHRFECFMDGNRNARLPAQYSHCDGGDATEWNLHRPRTSATVTPLTGDNHVFVRSIGHESRPYLTGVGRALPARRSDWTSPGKAMLEQPMLAEPASRESCGCSFAIT